MNFFKTIIAFSFTLFLVACGPAEKTVSEIPDTFKLGLLPTESATEMRTNAADLADFLSENMDQPVEVTIPNSYEALLEALRFGHIDAAFLDSGPAAIAHSQFGAEVVLAEVNNGETSYIASLFIRNDENEITELSDIIGKRIAFTSWTGSSGFLFPIGSLVNEDLITPEDDSLAALDTALGDSFAAHVFSGGYSQSLELLLNGQADVIGGAHNIAKRFLEPEDQGKIKKLVELGPVPSHPVVIHPKLSSEVRERFVSSMLRLNEEENRSILLNLYGVDELRSTDTKSHMTDFINIIKALPAIENKLMEKSH